MYGISPFLWGTLISLWGLRTSQAIVSISRTKCCRTCTSVYPEEENIEITLYLSPLPIKSDDSNMEGKTAMKQQTTALKKIKGASTIFREALRRGKRV